MTGKYGLIVIGGGPGGYVAAIRAAQLGLKVAVVESDHVGGTCLNRGCIPTKTLLHSAELFAQIKECEVFGLQTGMATYDMEKIHSRREQVQEQMRGGIEGLFKGRKIDLFSGRGRVTAPGEVLVFPSEGGDVQSLKGENLLIAVGAAPGAISIPGADAPFVLNSDDLLTGTGRDYTSLVIVGGGVIGVEFASIYSTFGCEVTILEAGDRILANLDKEISRSLAMVLKKKGVVIHTGAKVESFSEGENGLGQCLFTVKEEPLSVSAEGILVAIGRQANTEDLFDHNLPVEMERGRIKVDEHFQTTVPGIYAVGDVILGGIQLAHVASAQGLNAVCHMTGKEPEMDLQVVPSCVYTSPEIAQVGITADDAKNMGLAVKTGKYIMSSNGKTTIEMADRGFIKVVLDAETNVLLGAQMMCSRATDMIGEFSMAIHNQLTAEEMTAVIRPHPTFSEGITEAVESVFGMAIHMK